MIKNRTFYFIFFFVILGLVSEFFLWQAEQNTFFITVLAPVLTLSHFIQTFVVLPAELSPELNELIFVFPITLVYFGFAGYWIRQIFSERGFLRYFLILAFSAFLGIVHWQALDFVRSILYS